VREENRLEVFDTPTTYDRAMVFSTTELTFNLPTKAYLQAYTKCQLEKNIDTEASLFVERVYLVLVAVSY
jgi:hypothetical protein